jgi:hypothetical protein
MMPKPSPIIFSEKTGSLTSEIGMMCPSIGAEDVAAAIRMVDALSGK